MFDPMVIQSHRGPYTVSWDDSLLSNPARMFEGKPRFLIDAEVARLYASPLKSVIEHPNTIVIEATEGNKSIQGAIPIVERLVADSVRRDHTLIAIGGGIIQDITCFIASTLLRGIPWRFVPTTLLAQADSCIGSKSSINLGATKNILGTFNPPRDIVICSRFLDTLTPEDLRSGIGEIIKVHAIEGAPAFDRLALDFDRLLEDSSLLQRYAREALRIKQRFIEVDEFDRGIRNIFNYGHSFGHAIESATDYAVPHGIAVAMGMDMANSIAMERSMLPESHYRRMHPILRKTYDHFAASEISVGRVLEALTKDKKNTDTMFGLIFATGAEAEIQRVQVPRDAAFQAQCARFFTEMAR